ncbi:hypothetical protein M422DRAFT_61536 [Sphaerobolus stellatus SS14]|uniref:DUF6589 domain-containing protein n=1 Tax=Sphaerobolus stellatus (strain SS14) TaxID=990650 RepID=A0A0C9V4W0_SPHS4|nr:hypothetical protein M422DRAFT_61536 [Sphaerobolus stellatus SS14]
MAGGGTSQRVVDTLAHMGLSVSYRLIQHILEGMTRSAKALAHKVVKDPVGDLTIVVFDNINFTQHKTSQRFDNTTNQINATTVVIKLPSKFTKAAYCAALSLQRRPVIRSIGHEKTEFFPLPAINEEESSVQGTIKVVKYIFLKLLKIGEQVSCKMNWVQEASMPFHFQLNAIHMLFHTHFGYPGDNNPATLDIHHRILQHSVIDPQKPKYNRAWELLEHSLIVRILDCTWYVAMAMQAGQRALEANDHVLSQSIFFMCDALMFWEFCDAIHYADVGRMWVVYDFWLFMMCGAGLNNYSNEIMEMKVQYEQEFTPELREVMENTWLVNRWGLEGCSIPTDLYLEHNNGFIKVFL